MTQTIPAPVGAYRIDKKAGPRGTFPHGAMLKSLGLRWSPEIGAWHTDSEDAWRKATLVVTGEVAGDPIRHDSAEAPSPGGHTADQGTEHTEPGEGEGEPSEQADEGDPADLYEDEGTDGEQADEDAEGDEGEGEGDKPGRDVGALNDRELTKVMQAVRQATGQRLGDPARRTEAEEAAGMSLTNAKRERIKQALPDASTRLDLIAEALGDGAGNGAPSKAPGAAGQGNKPATGQAKTLASGQPQPGKGEKQKAAQEQAQQVFGKAGIEAIESLVNAGLDEDRVREIAREEDAAVIKATAEMGDVLAKAIAEIDTRVKESARQAIVETGIARQEVLIQVAEGPKVSTAGMHWQAPMIAALAKAGLNVALIGPPGTGKTYVADSVATLLGLQVASAISCNQAMSESAFSARVLPIGDGKVYFSTWLLGVEHGGVCLVDEFDSAPGDVVVMLNSTLAVTPGSGKGIWVDSRAIAGLHPFVPRHKDHVVIVAMNTFFGRQEGNLFTARSPLDGATADRFFSIRFDADPTIEARMFGASKVIGAKQPWTPDKTPFTGAEADAWYAWFKAVQAALETLKAGHLVWGQRVGEKMVKARSVGISRDDVLASLLMGFRAPDLAKLGNLAKGPAF